VEACTSNYQLMTTTFYTDTSKIPTVKAAANALLTDCNPRYLTAYGYIRWSDISLWLSQAPLDPNTGLPRPADEGPAQSLFAGLTITLGDKDGAARGFRPEDRVRVDVLPISEFGLSSVSLELSVATLDQLLGAGQWKNDKQTAYVVPGALFPTTLPEPAVPSDADLTPPLTPPGASLSAPQGANPSTYTVQAGDTANNIARKFNITLEALIAANPTTLGVNPNLLQVGDVLNIPAP
jgi:LysM repeat protein